MKHPDKLLTIGMACYDDYDGVVFSCQSLRMHHDLCKTDDVEILVLDNNPDSAHGKVTKTFVENGMKDVGRYVEKRDRCSSFNKYDIVDLAYGKYVLIMDCHVLLQQNALENLITYYRKNKNCRNLVQGPLIYDNGHDISTHFAKKWRGQMYGVWETNREKYEKGDPFEINMQGMGLLSFEKKNWPGIHSGFKGFGGEEGYIAEKFRNNGGKNICLPQLGWWHRFGRPNGVKYPLTLEDRMWNYFLGWMDATGDEKHEVIRGAVDHFSESLPKERVIHSLQKVKQYLNKGYS